LSAPTSSCRLAAASVLVRDVLVGRVVQARVVAAGPLAAYVDVGGRLVAVVTAGAVRLPCAVVVPAGPVVAPTAVGAGALWLGDEPIARVGRWFDPRVRFLSVETVAMATVSTDRTRDALLPADAVDRFADALGAGDALGAVRPVLGRGTGLTPAGDDLIAGALAALRAFAAPLAAPLGAAVLDLAPERTTRLSAALLAAADEGAVIPEAAAVLRALAGLGEPGAALDRLVAVGHTSGAFLAAGLLIGARLAADLVGAA
jgi:hypothetical protein